jgi:hypothetical protein
VVPDKGVSCPHPVAGAKTGVPLIQVKRMGSLQTRNDEFLSGRAKNYQSLLQMYDYQRLDNAMKIGILTYHFSASYGAMLQAYALKQYINQQGHEAEIIDYRPLKITLSHIKSMFIQKRHSLYLPHSHMLEQVKRYIKIERFVSNSLTSRRRRVSTRTQLQEASKWYDIIVCGSDVIWRYEPFPRGRGFDSAFFLDFVSNSNLYKAAYAASAAPTTTFAPKNKEICQYLRNLDALSVRDTHTQKLLQKECNLEATKVIDPTFLIDFHGMTNHFSSKNEYMLIYGILKPVESQYARIIADQHGLELVAIGDFNQLADRNIIAIGTEEWLDYVANAAYVFTTYFHGLIFSIIFRRPFVVFDKPSKSVKVKDLVESLHLQDRVLSDDKLKNTFLEMGGHAATNDEFFSGRAKSYQGISQMHDYLEMVDFDAVQARIKPLVQISHTFLENILMQ